LRGTVLLVTPAGSVALAWVSVRHNDTYSTVQYP
jgi:hypothetical protein